MDNKNHAWIVLLLLAIAMPLSVEAQVRAIYDQGSGALIRQLLRLGTTASVMHTGAHPDDEDSALVAYHARRMHARTAYLSLTRGSGGQNIIGVEQSDALGVIRTEELLQARRLDGAEQLFTRANDFGFSKYRTEASRVWPEELLLDDMVRAIRTFRPSVIVSRWNGTVADGHGHHQFAGYLTPLALEAAADSNRFPEHIAQGLTPWQVQKFYTGRAFTGSSINVEAAEQPALLINTGEYDPVTGRSYFEIGMQGRSQQKTQQMGTLELRGGQQSQLFLLTSQFEPSGAENSIFSGIDTTITGISTLEQAPSVVFVEILSALQQSIDGLMSVYDPLNPEALIPNLVDGLELAREASDVAQALDAKRLLDEKVSEFEKAIVLAAGVSIDALAESETAIPGTVLTVAVRAFMAQPPQVLLREAYLSVPVGWSVSASNVQMLSNERSSRRKEQGDAEMFFDVSVPASADPTQPYWLALPREGAAYDWSTAGEARTRPFAEPLLEAVVTLEIGGTQITIRQEVEHRLVDRIRGEIRRRLDVVPAVSVEPGTDLVVVPISAGDAPRELLLTVRNNTSQDVAGRARFEVPQGWVLEPPSAEFSLAAAPATTTLAFRVTMDPGVSAGEYKLAANVTVNGTQYNKTMREIAYPHIRTHRIYSPSVTEFEVVDVSIAASRVGYVMGSGDTVPEALRRLGVEVMLLTDAELTTGDFSSFDAIVVGIRASQTRPAYVANNQRLLEYAEQGGNLIVQYQQPDFIAKGLAPYGASMDGNVRVVDETAAIVILEPEHPVFTFPNRIDARDFDGWVQERNNYNFTSFDRDRYIPLTEAHDQGEPISDGGMLYAKIGDGHYIYTSYSWFRQLPNGVPGAYRLFANLLSLSAAAN